MIPCSAPLALTFDFYETLVHPRRGIGRGARGATFMAFLAELGLQSDPWEHQAIYDIFELHGVEYDPRAGEEERIRYYERIAERVFRRLNVRAPEGTASEHATRIWEIMGPASLAVFPDVRPALEALRQKGRPMAVVSNWQKGLDHFLVELGLREFFDEVVVSVEVGSVKPDSGIFLEACRRLGVAPARVLHVGDSYVDDWQGGRRAGLEVVIIRRDPTGDEEPDVPVIRSLREISERYAIH